jgi:hypothetical protein
MHALVCVGICTYVGAAALTRAAAGVRVQRVVGGAGGARVDTPAGSGAGGAVGGAVGAGGGDALRPATERRVRLVLCQICFVEPGYGYGISG